MIDGLIKNNKKEVIFVKKLDFISGFTLIELLIVVAIIAILAAIAVPNFLEAQVRSKVSRVKADMRSTATALEAYYVDSNKYPPDAQYGWLSPPGLVQYKSYLPRFTHLTTPIAYESSVMEDVFAVQAVSKSTVLDDPYRVPYGTGPLVHPFPYDYACKILPNGGQELVSSWANISANPNAVMWALRSCGPDLVATVLGDPTAVIYDPTNGTVSSGDIFFTGPGIGIDGPRR